MFNLSKYMKILCALFTLNNDLAVIASKFSQFKIICIPTDTIYAISCEATNINAVKKIYSIKKRSFSKTLPMFVSCVNMAQKYINFINAELKIARLVWPGAITFVSKLRNNQIPGLLIQKNKIAIRVPKCNLICNICRYINKPIVATSANISSRPSISKMKELIESFYNKVDCIISNNLKLRDNNVTSSTILEFIKKDKIKILREGRIKTNELEQIMKFM